MIARPKLIEWKSTEIRGFKELKISHAYPAQVTTSDFATTLALAGDATSLFAVDAVTALDYVGGGLRDRLVANRALDRDGLCGAFEHVAFFGVPENGTSAAIRARLGPARFNATRDYFLDYGKTAALVESTCGRPQGRAARRAL